jgi:hypothetical protein
MVQFLLFFRTVVAGRNDASVSDWALLFNREDGGNLFLRRIFVRLQNRMILNQKTTVLTFYDDWLTVHRSITLVDFQLDAQNSYLFTYNTFIKILYMLTWICLTRGGYALHLTHRTHRNL